MHYPTLRYGDQNQFIYYAQGIPIAHLAKQLRRSERSVKQWLTGARKMPWWIPEILRLQHMEHQARLYQMNIQPVRLKLGIATGSVIHFPVASPHVKTPPTISGNRLNVESSNLTHGK